MPDIKDSVIESVKSILLPELRKLHEGQTGISIRQETIEKQLAIMNENILGNSRRIDDINKRIDELNRRIDDTNKRIDDTNKRIDELGIELGRKIDETNKRIDLVFIELGNIKKEMERLKREEVITGDIIHRMEILEEKVLLGK